MAQLFTVNNKIFDVDDENLQKFMEEYPNAQPYKQESAEAGKISDLPTMDAGVSQENVQASASDLLSENTFLDSPKEEQLVDDDPFKFNDEVQEKLEKVTSIKPTKGIPGVEITTKPINISDEQKNEILQEVNSINLNPYSTKKNIGDKFQRQSIDITVQPYEDKIEQAKKELKFSGIENPSTEEVHKQTRDILLRDKALSLSELGERTERFLKEDKAFNELRKQRIKIQQKATRIATENEPTKGLNPSFAKKYIDDFVNKELSLFDEQNSFELNKFKQGSRSIKSEKDISYNLQLKALENISKDTNDNSFGTGLSGFSVKALEMFGIELDEATQVLDLDSDVRKEILLNLSDRDLIKSAKYDELTLEQKEEIIKNARTKVFSKKATNVSNNVNNLNNSHEKLMVNLSEEYNKAVVNRDKLKDNNGEIIAGKEDEYNKLNDLVLNATQKGKSQMNAYKNSFNDLKKDFETIAGIYNIDQGTGVIKNSFKLTDEAIAKREQFAGDGAGNSTADSLATFFQALVDVTSKGSVGAASWLISSLGDLTTSSDEIYSVYDGFQDTVMNTLDTRVLPVSQSARLKLLDEEGNVQWKGRNFLKMMLDMLPFSLTLMRDVKKGKIPSANQIVGRFVTRNSALKKGLSLTKDMKQKMIMVDSGFRMTIADNVRDGQEQGLNSFQAQVYGTTIASATGLSQLIMPDVNFVKSSVGQNLLKDFRGTLRSVANKKAASAATKQFFSNMGLEYGEEQFELAAEISAKRAAGLALGDVSDFIAQQKQIIAGVGMLSTGLGSIGSLSTYKQTKQTIYDEVLKQPEMTVFHLEALKKSTNNKKEIKEIDKSIQFANSIIKAGKIAPENVTASQIDLLIEKQKILEQKKGLDPAFHGEINEKLKVINDKITAETKQKLDENILFAKSAESIGLKTETVSADEFGKRTSGKAKGKSYKNAKGQEGAFLNDADGTILINKDVALEQGAVSVGSHEVLHPILNAMIGDVEQQGKIVEQFKKRIGKDAFNWVEKELTSRGVTGDKRKTEFINVYNDGIITKKIKFNDGFWQKFGEYVADLFRAKGFRNIKFETGQDVYEFMKEFEKSRKEGKLRSNIVEAVGDVGGERGVLRQSKPQLSSSIVEKTQEELVSEVNQAYNEDASESKDSAAFEIAQQYQGMAEKAFERSLNSAKTEDQRNSLLQNKDDIIRSMLWDKIPKQKETSKHRNVFGLVKDFVKEKQKYGNVAAYINTFFARRSNEVLTAFQEKAPLTKSMSDEKIQSKVEKVLEEKSTTDKGPKARKVTSFDKLIKTFNTEGDISFVSEDLKQEILTKLEKTIKLKVSKGDFKAKDITTEIESLIKEEIENTVKERMGKISQTKVDGKKQVVVSEEYKSFHNENFETIVKALPVATIKKKYLKLFESKVIGREKTGPGNAIFEIKPTSKGKFGAYFTIGGYTTLLARQKSLANEISAELIKDSTTSLKTDEKFLNDIIDIASLSDIEITQTILQTELESLTNQFDRKKSENQKFDNIQFSSSINTDQKLDLKNKLPEIKNKVKETGAKPTPSVVRNILNSTLDAVVYSKKEIVDLSNSISKAITKFTKETNVEALEKVNFASFALEEIAQDAVATNLIKSLKLKIKSFTDAFNNKLVDEEGKPIDTISKQRALSIGYNMKLIEEEGVDGVIKVFKWFTGHQTSAGKIGGTRAQIYEGSPDWNNIFGKVELNKNKSKDGVRFYTVTGKNVKFEYRIGKPGVDKKGRPIKGKSTIQKMSYSKDGKVFKEIENFNEKISKPQQKVFDESVFVEEYDKRKEQADEAWNTLIDYLTYIKENGTALDFGMTMMSLKSNMASMLKAAAPVEYYYVGPKTKLSDLRYEHIIPTEYIVLKLTEHFSGNKIDLQKLKDVYKVAIIPKSMDVNINIQRQQTMGADWTTDMHETLRYYDDVTAGNTNMFAIKSLGDGKIYGEEHVKLAPRVMFSNSIVQTEKAIEARNKERKGISVLDFDDTLAVSNSKIIVTSADGKVSKITPAKFATDAGILEDEGATFNFDEFNDVKGGKPGPFLKRALELQEKFGSKDMFILTARPAAAASAIQKFLKSVGLNIPLKNITGLENGSPLAKADFMLEKAAEGYNDFLFADDALGNVNAVKKVLDIVDVKSDVQQVQFSNSLSKDFNNIIEENKGIKSQYTYSSVAAKKMGANKGKYKFFVPPSADDLVGLLYHFAGKGAKGEKQLKFFKDNIIRPFSIAMQKLDAARQSISNDYKALKNDYSDIKKLLPKATNYSNFTHDTAIRVYLWSKAGYTIPGLSKRDIKALSDIVKNDPYLKEFADNLNLIPKSEKGYTPPGESWQAGNIPSDLDSATGKIGRKKYLEQFTANVDSIFSQENLNKIEAVYGSNLREALEDMIYRMKNGKNRSFGENRLVNGLMNWINNSVGAIMFFNAKSAVLQTLSMTNFINLGDNNILKAGAAFANQKQYWSDFSMIFNSDFLKQRRSGLKTDVNEAEIADAVRNSSNKAKAAISYLLKKGFLPTQLADSFAIASGGAGFFRNRTKSLMEQGMSKADAETQAFKDFREITEENQQSSRPDKISQQQAGPLGRVILAFANTPAQYTRIMKKSFLDLKNGRGDWKTHVSKIMYYGVIQNFIFGAMQNALFSMAFGDDEEDEKFEARYIRVGDSMVDSVLRGSGLAGAAISTLKSVVLKLYSESEKKRPKYQDATWELLNFAPPIDSKVTKIRSAFRALDYNMKEIKNKGFNFSNPAWMASAQVISATTNIPLDRLIRKTNNIIAATNAENEAYQRFALALGWSEWDLGIQKKKSKKSTKRKTSPAIGGVTL